MDTNLHIQKLYSKPSYRLPHTEPPQQMAPQRIESQFKPVRDLQQIKKKLIQIKLIAYNTPYSSHELNFLFNEIIYIEYPLFLIFMPLFKEERTYCFAAVCRLVSQSTNSFRSFFFAEEAYVEMNLAYRFIMIISKPSLNLDMIEQYSTE